MENIIQQNLTSIRGIISDNMNTIKSLQEVTKESVVTTEQLTAVYMLQYAALLYNEIKDQLEDEEREAIRQQFSEVNDIFNSIGF